jgi:hypothetical protein
MSAVSHTTTAAPEMIMYVSLSRQDRADAAQDIMAAIMTGRTLTVRSDTTGRAANVLEISVGVNGSLTILTVDHETGRSDYTFNVADRIIRDLVRQAS